MLLIDFSTLANAGIQRLRAYDPGHDLVALRRRFVETQLVSKPLLELGSNENPYGASPRAKQAVVDALAGIHIYPDPLGGDLKRALASHHGIAPGNLMLGNGSHELLMQFAQVFAGPGDEVVASKFGFAVYALAAQAVGAELRLAPALPREHAPHAHAMPRGHDLTALLEAIGPRTKLVYLANPNNPTGTWFDAAAFDAFIQRVPDNVIVVVDEAYAEYVDAPEWRSAFDWLAAYPNLIVTCTFSKAHALAGLRVGYALAAPGLAAAFNKVRNHFGVGRVAQAGALAALADQDWLAHVRERVDASRAAIASIAKENGLTPLPSATNFVTIDCGRDGTFARAVLNQLVARGIFVRMPFVAPHDRCIRISCGDEAALAALAEVLPQALAAARS